MQQVKLFDLGRRISVVDNEHFTVENNEKHKKITNDTNENTTKAILCRVVMKEAVFPGEF